MAISKAFDIPTSWKCTAIMPVRLRRCLRPICFRDHSLLISCCGHFQFGTPVGPAGNPAHPKDFKPLEDRVKVIR